MQDDSMNPALQVDVLAAALRSSNRESSNLIEWLSQMFEGMLPAQTTVVREGWFLSSKKEVKELTLRFDEVHYVLTRKKSGQLSAKQLKVVRDVVLKTSEVPMDKWIESLAGSLSVLSEADTSARQALSSFLLGQ
jgi:hypothetical protein